MSYWIQYATNIFFQRIITTIIHFVSCNCINDALIISSWYLIDRKLYTFVSSKNKKMLQSSRIAYIPFAFWFWVLFIWDGKIQFLSVAFLFINTFVWDVQAIILAYYFLFIRVEIHCWIKVCVLYTFHMCYTKWTTYVIYKLPLRWYFGFCTDFHWPKIRLI